MKTFVYFALIFSYFISTLAKAQKRIVINLDRRAFIDGTDYSGDTIEPIYRTKEERIKLLQDEMYRNLEEISRLNDEFRKELYGGRDEFYTPVKFDSAVFVKDADFYKTKFKDKTSFRETLFIGKCDFRGAEFDDEVSFFKVRFNGTADFKIDGRCDFFYCVFLDSVDFEGSIFQYITGFDRARFRDYVDFHGIEASGALFFEEVIFANSVNFSNAKLAYGNFDRSQFWKTVDFSNSTFGEIMSFDNAVFNNKLDLHNISTSDSFKFSFIGTCLPDTIDISSCRDLKTGIDLTTANYTSPSRYNANRDEYKEGRFHYINLYGTDISKLNLDYNHFRLILVNPITGTKLSFDEATSMYEALLNNFKVKGKMDSYKWLDIEYQDYRWGKRPAIFRWWKFVAKSWNLYGYDKERVILWTGALLFLFTIISFFTLTTLQSAYRFETFPALPTLKSIFTGNAKAQSFRTRFWYSFVYTSGLFFMLWLRLEKLDYKNWKAVLYIVAVYLMGIICLAYIANLILQR